MVRKDFWFLLRFGIITGIYLLECIFLQANLMILDFGVFVCLLFLYFVVIIISFFLNDTLKRRIKIISDIVFVGYFFIMIFISICIQSCGLGDGIIASVCIFLLCPMIICFSVFLVRDIKYIERDNE